MAEAGYKTVAAQPGSKAPVSIFVEETGKTGFAHLVDLASLPTSPRSTRATRSS